MKRERFVLIAIVTILGIVLAAHGGVLALSGASPAGSTIEWTHFSSATGDLPPPSNATQQTASLILDVDKDGLNDFVIGSRRAGPAMVWYQRDSDGWTKYLVDDATLDIEAGGAYYDIDRDGDLDVVMGGDARSNKMWWWENPYPSYEPDTPWTRREIKNSGSNKHHDQIFGDFDGDGQAELVFWNQHANRLFIADIPSDPQNTQPWPYQEIFSWSSGEFEGLAKADVNEDGKMDVVGGGRWFEHNGGTSYTPHIIDDSQTFTRAGAGQLKAGGRPEVVFVAGDGVGRLKWYEWTGSTWEGHDLLGFDVDHGHSLEVADIDGDGNLDVF
ncbi:MAG: VCBS repeat-containing protein, partial [Anaerolineae bacterium]|nr:VCBS repeat-containing protein [Anaerolineae bacterium]